MTTIAADEHLSYVRDYFSDEAHLHFFSGRKVTPDEIKNADILLVRSVTRVDERLLSGSKIRFVGSLTAGADHLDLAWLKQHGIHVQLAHGFNAQAVSDYVLSVLFTLEKERRIALNDRLTAAIVGVGATGSHVFSYFKKLGIKTFLFDPVRAEQEPLFKSCTWEEVSKADVISVHVPWTQNVPHSTHRFLNKDLFQRLKSNTILINASRGDVLDEEDFMRFGHHLLLCSDVWTNEPRCNLKLIEQSYLATPHIAGYSLESKSRGMHFLHEAMRVYGFPFSKKTMQNFSEKIIVREASLRDALLAVFDVRSLSDQFKFSMLTSEKPAHMFDEWRKTFPLRHEFPFVEFDVTRWSVEDRGRLKTYLGM